MSRLSLVGSTGLVGLHVVIDLAVAVGVDDDRGPALSLRLVAGLFPDLAVDPADGALLRAAGAHPHRVVGIFRQHDVVGVEAGADQLGGVGLRDRRRRGRRFDVLSGNALADGLIRAVLAERRDSPAVPTREVNQTSPRSSMIRLCVLVRESQIASSPQ